MYDVFLTGTTGHFLDKKIAILQVKIKYLKTITNNTNNKENFSKTQINMLDDHARRIAFRKICNFLRKPTCRLSLDTRALASLSRSSPSWGSLTLKLK